MPPDKLAARAGIEPASVVLEAAIAALRYETEKSTGAQHGAQISGALAEVVKIWPGLPAEIRAAVATLVRAAGKGRP